MTEPWDESGSVQDAQEDPGKTSWVDTFMTRRVMSIGCGLGQEERSLWWLLGARSELSMVGGTGADHCGTGDGCPSPVSASAAVPVYSR